MQWEKRRPHRALDIPECPCRLSHPFTGILPCFFFFPLVLLMKITQPLKKPSPTTAWIPHNSQETTTKLFIKTACSFHGAFCWRCVSRSYPPSPPLPAPTRQNTIKPSGIWGSFKNPKNDSSVSRGKSLPKPSWPSTGSKKNGKSAQRPCSAPPKRWIIWPAAPPMPRTPGARWTGISSSSASIPKARWPTTACTGRHGCGAKSSATRPVRKNCSNRSSKNTLLPIRPRTPPVTLRRSRPKKNGNRLPPPARQASKNSLEANRSVSA